MNQKMIPEFRYYLAGQWCEGKKSTISCPYDQIALSTVHHANPMALEKAIQSAVNAFKITRQLPSCQRSDALRKVADKIRINLEDLARTIALEAGKPIRQARTEVNRSASIFETAAEEASRIHDEVLHLDALPGGEQREAVFRRFPLGPIAAITPFNFPLNQVSHKVAPAMAAGCPVVLKPASQTPIVALKLAKFIEQSGWPIEALSVLPISSQDAAPLIEDDRFKLLTFTGSAEVGWDLKKRSGKKRVTLELGGNAGVIIHEDANLKYAVSRCVVGGFYYAGQSCISVQRIFIHQKIYQQFLDLFLPQVSALKIGHPLDESADLCCVISDTDGKRIASWIQEAKDSGAKVLVGGKVEGKIIQPTVIENAQPQLKVNSCELFAPVVTVHAYQDFKDAIDAVNNSQYGLQAGVFTNDLQRIYFAYNALEVGGVMVNEVSTWRMDPMPYGGVKESGHGREGVKYAIEEMTEGKLLALNLSS